MKNTQFKIEDVFGDVINKDNFGQEKKLNLKIFYPKQCEYYFWYKDKFN